MMRSSPACLGFHDHGESDAVRSHTANGGTGMHLRVLTRRPRRSSTRHRRALHFERDALVIFTIAFSMVKRRLGDVPVPRPR